MFLVFFLAFNQRVLAHAHGARLLEGYLDVYGAWPAARVDLFFFSAFCFLRVLVLACLGATSGAVWWLVVANVYLQLRAIH